jgi:DNA-binding NarL/FixJ family response regulator
VVVVTAMDDASVSAAALDAGASEFVPKRLVAERLLSAIHSACSQRL